MVPLPISLANLYEIRRGQMRKLTAIAAKHMIIILFPRLARHASAAEIPLLAISRSEFQLSRARKKWHRFFPFFYCPRVSFLAFPGLPFTVQLIQKPISTIESSFVAENYLLRKIFGTIKAPRHLNQVTCGTSFFSR